MSGVILNREIETVKRCYLRNALTCNAITPPVGNLR